MLFDTFFTIIFSLLLIWACVDLAREIKDFRRVIRMIREETDEIIARSRD